MEALYEDMRHGRDDYRIATYSEDTWGAGYRYHEDYEILYVDRGKLYIGIEEKRHEAPAGTIFFFDKNRPHYVDETQSGEPGSFHWYAILFNELALGTEDDCCRAFFRDNLINTKLEADEYLCGAIAEMNRIDWSEEKGYEFRTKALMLNIIAHIIETKQYRRRRENRGFSADCLAVNRIVDIIEERYPDKLELEGLAGEVGYSAKHLSRIFRKYTGTSVISYLINYRIRRACSDLLYTDKTITRISLECGFRNVSYFNRMFLRQIKVTPGEYRRASEKMDGFRRAAIETPKTP